VTLSFRKVLAKLLVFWVCIFQCCAIAWICKEPFWFLMYLRIREPRVPVLWENRIKALPKYGYFKNLKEPSAFMKEPAMKWPSFKIWEPWLYTRIGSFDLLRIAVMNPTDHPDNHGGVGRSVAVSNNCLTLVYSYVFQHVIIHTISVSLVNIVVPWQLPH